MQPGSMPLQNNGMPNIPHFSGGGAGGMGGGMMPPPSMPQGATSAPNGGAAQGMFSGLASNPMLMAMLAKNMQGGQMQGQTPPAAYGQGTAPMNGNVPLPSQQGAYNVPAQGGIQALLARMFGGQGGQS